MASEKTKLTELGTAVGLVAEPGALGPWQLAQLEVPGLPAEAWQPTVLGAARAGGAQADLLARAVANGQAFRQRVLRGRLPEHVTWTGASRSVWLSDVPRDLTVDGVWFIQAKYDSRCVLNTSPGVLVDSLLIDDEAGTRPSWFEEVALRELASYYRAIRAQAPVEGLPADVRDLAGPHRQALKAWMRSRPEPAPGEDDAYHDLCRVVSIETVRRWRLRLRAATAVQQTLMLFRMLRIAGGPYWLLGAKGTRPVRLRVDDTRTWRQRFELKGFATLDANAGQPQVDWRAEVLDRQAGEVVHVEGCCEIRWSHGKLQGNPECKVQVTTALEDVPGYEPVA